MSVKRKNYPRAKTSLGTFFLKDLGGCPLDKAKAFDFFIEAAIAGHVRAMFNCAHMLEMGDGIAADLPQALKWYEQAAAKGDEQAQQRVKKIKE